MYKLKYLFLVLIFLMGFSTTSFANTKNKIENKIHINYLKGIKNKNKYLLILPFKTWNTYALEDAITITDSNNKKIRIHTYNRNYNKSSSISISADFLPNENYSLSLKTDFKLNNKHIYSFNVNNSFRFKQKPLTTHSFKMDTKIPDIDSAKIVLNFFEDKIRTKNIRDYLSFDSKNLEFTYKVEGDELTIYGDFKPNKKYRFTLKKGFAAGFKKLEKDLNLKATFSNLDKNLKFKNQNAYISSYSEAIEVNITNIDQLKVKIYRVNEENLNYLTIFKNQFLNNDYYLEEYRFKEFSELIDEYKKSLVKIKNRETTTKLSFKDRIKYQKDGIYFISIENKKNELIKSKLLYKSDLGISAKISKNQLFLSLRSLAQNSVIKDAEVHLYSKKNKLIFKGKTNKDGILNKSYKNLVKESPRLIIVKKSNQINFLNLRKPISDYDILNDNSSELNSEYKALIFMERTLLRPSDKVNMLITVKDKNLKSLVNENIYIKVFNPLSTLISDDVVKLNEVGALEYSFTSYNEFKTGKYRLNVYLGNTQIGTKEFYVEAFIPEKIEVNMDVQKKEILSSQKVDFTIKSKYLFAAPAKDLTYDFEAIAKASFFKSKQYKDYKFQDLLSKQTIFMSKYIFESGTLNEKGEKNYNINIPLEETTYSAIDTSLLATVYDDGRPVREYKQVTIYPFESVVGIKKAFEGDAKTNSNIKFKTVLLDVLKDKKISKNEKLKVQVFKKFWHYYAPDEIREIASFEVNSKDDIEFTPRRSGEHYICVSTADGQTSSLKFYVSGWGNEPSNLRDKSAYKVSLKTDKNIYKPNETISIDIKSPIKGKLLLTIEEDKIIEYSLVELNTNSAHINLKMPKNIKKGAYIKAHVVRSTKKSDEVFPFRVIGSTFIKKDNSHKDLKAELIIDKIHKSKDDIKIKVKTKDSNLSYAVVSLVDKGILNIVDEKNTDAFDFYDKQEKNRVSLYDLYSNLQQHIVLKAQSISGGGIERKRSKHNSPDSINERVKPVSFWSKIVKLDKNGEAEISFKTKNFNGELRAQTLVVNKDKISSATKYTVVKDDIIVKPVLPRFLMQDDLAIIPLRLINTSDSSKELKLEIETSDNISIKTDSKTIFLNKKESVLENIQIKALKPGISKIKIKAISNNEIFTNETSIYIKDKYDYKVVSKYGTLNKNSSTNIKVMDKETKVLNFPIKTYVSIDNTPFAKLSKSYNDLIGYPYGCAEQTSSKILAMLVSEKFIDKNDKKALNLREKYIQEGINKLISMQNNSGFFTYWSDGYHINKYASYYALYVLQMAKSFGFDVPTNTIENAQSAHWYYFDNSSSNLDFFIFQTDEKTANKIYDNNQYGNSLTSYISLAVAMKKAGNIEESNKLVEKARENFYNYDTSKERKYDGSFYSPIKDIASALFLYKKFINSDINDYFSKELIRTVNNYIEKNDLYSTQDKAFAMLSVISYYKDFSSDKNSIDLNLSYENKVENIKNRLYKEIVLDSSDTISLKNSASPINYTIDINKPIDLPVNSNKSDLNKTIFLGSNLIDKNGKYVDLNNIKLGDKLFFEVKLYSNKKIENVAVNIQIPSGLELINSRLNKANNSTFENTNYNPDYEDFRDDRFLTFLTTNKSLTKFYIPVSAVTKGEFIYPASYVEAMYDSRINNYYKAAKKLIIK